MTRIIEDLTYEDFKAIADLVPAKLPLGDLEKASQNIADKFNLPLLDAKGTLFVAFTIKTMSLLSVMNTLKVAG